LYLLFTKGIYNKIIHLSKIFQKYFCDLSKSYNTYKIKINTIAVVNVFHLIGEIIRHGMRMRGPPAASRIPAGTAEESGLQTGHSRGILPLKETYYE
jgi:hypothetical protein